MKHFYLLACAAFLMIACKNQSTPKEIQIATIQYPTSIQSITDTLPTLKSPFSIDSSYFQLDTIDTNFINSIDIETLKLLTSKLAYDPTSMRETHYINSFIDIQEAKKSDKYTEYVAGLEGGMMQDAAANFIGKMHINDSVGLAIWSLKYISSDTTPSYNGHHILGSLFMNGKLVSCMHLGNNDRGNDEPMAYEVYQLFSINDKGEIAIRNYSKSFEGAVILEEDHKQLSYIITKKGFKFLPRN